MSAEHPRTTCTTGPDCEGIPCEGDRGRTCGRGGLGTRLLQIWEELTDLPSLGLPWLKSIRQSSMGVTPSSTPCIAWVSIQYGSSRVYRPYVEQQQSAARLIQDASLEKRKLLLAILLEILRVGVAVLLGPGRSEPIEGAISLSGNGR